MTSVPATPYLVVDEEVLRDNIARMAARGRDAGFALRPHVKTHKCLEIARLQVQAGAVGITVATLGEAEVFAEGGFDDIFIAYPLWVDTAKIERIRALAQRCRLRVGVDSLQGVAQLARAAARAGAVPLEVVVEVDSGHHRSGVSPGEAGGVARAVIEAGLACAGIFTFPGHSYALGGGRAQAGGDEAAALAQAATRLRAAGVEPRIVSGGSTPSLEFADSSVATERRPGVYVFGDAQQWELGSARADEIALTAYATVVSHAGGRAVLDSGSKVIGADRAGYATGFGRLLDYPDARIVLLSEHHAVVDMVGGELPELGSIVRVVPNHVCNAVNLVDKLV
ncbi:MAG: alanine racemase, partial [Micrococcales bacterium]|nr:alanine racemase [Micrococcales bacterium]